MTRAKDRDLYILSAPEAGMVMGVSSPTVLRELAENEAFRDKVQAPIPGKFVAIYLVHLCRWICKDIETDAAEMVARWLPKIEAHRSGEQVAS